MDNFPLVIGKYFWLIALVVNGINVAIFYQRAQPYIKENPALASGYMTIFKGFFLGSSLPFVIMGIGILSGNVANVFAYLNPWDGNIFVVAWWAVLTGTSWLLAYWVWLRGGAEMLAAHPGLFTRGMPITPSYLKLFTLLSALMSVVMPGLLYLEQPMLSNLR
jgi:hypothetical protein